MGRGGTVHSNTKSLALPGSATAPPPAAHKPNPGSDKPWRGIPWGEFRDAHHNSRNRRRPQVANVPWESHPHPEFARS